MKPEDIEPGKSYACKYTDLAGVECLALVITRDTEKQLLKLRDVATGHEFTVSYDQVRDLDTVEWVDA